MQCQSIKVPNLEETYPLSKLMVDAIGKYVQICADSVLNRKLEWFNQEVVEKILKITHPETMVGLLSAQQEKYGKIY